MTARLGILSVIGVLALGLALLPSRMSAAETPTPEEHVLSLYWTDTPPVLDGKMDDACWKDAEVAGDFTLLNTYGPPAEQTEVRAAYDAENLYFFWTMHETYMDKLSAGGQEPENPRHRDTSLKYTREDVIELFLDPGKTTKTAFHFMSNPAGCRYDSAMGEGAPSESFDYQADWQQVPGRAKGAWTMEMKIPFRELVLPGKLLGTPQPGDQWGMNFCRARYPVAREFSSWSPTYAGFGNRASFGHVYFRGRRGGAQLPTVTEVKPGPLSYGPGAVELKVQGAGQVQAMAELHKDGAPAADLTPAVQGAEVSIPYRLLDQGDYHIVVKLASGGQTFYSAGTKAKLHPGKWDILKGMDQGLEEGRKILNRSQNRHPAFVRLMRALEDFDARSRHAREAIGRPETLSGEEWAALAQETVDLLPDWNELQFDLNLARLYPGPANNTVRLFALGDANETEKVYRDALYQGSLSDPIRISVAGNEWASFQLQVLPFWRRLTEAQVSFSDLKGPGGHILPADRYLWFRMNYIKVTNDDPYTPGSFHYEPDPLMPAEPFMARPGQITPLWVDYKLPAGTPAGVYRGTVTVTAHGQSVSRPVEIRSHGFDIPLKSSLETDWWFGLYNWQRFYGREATPYTPAAHAKQAAVLGRYRISSFPSDWTTICRQVPIYREPDGKFTFDWSNFDQYMKNALDNHTTALWSALSCNSGWTAFLNNPNVSFTDRATGKQMKLGDIYKPEVWNWRTSVDCYTNNPLYRDFLVAYVQHLKDLGINESSYYELFDESNNSPGLLQLVEHHTFFRKLVPDLQLADFGYEPSCQYAGQNVLGLIDAWAPGLGHLEETTDYSNGKTVIELINERRATTNEKAWAYSCGEGRDPDGNYTPFMIYDHSYQALRMHGWFAWKYRLDGYLLFMLAAVGAENIKADPAERWPNSDWEWSSGPWCGTMIYPGPDWQVIPGQRLSLARKGLEDLEYFVVLEKAAQGLDPVRDAALLERVQAALDVDPEIIQTIYLWSKDRDVLEAKREQLASLILEVEHARR